MNIRKKEGAGQRLVAAKGYPGKVNQMDDPGTGSKADGVWAVLDDSWAWSLIARTQLISPRFQT